MIITNRKLKDISILLLVLTISILSSMIVVKKVVEPLVSSISGVVEHGEGISREYGYPTANMRIKESLPCGAWNGESKYGTTTVLTNGSGKVEAHIHDFNKKIYGEKLIIDNLRMIKGIGVKREKQAEKNCVMAKLFMNLKPF